MENIIAGMKQNFVDKVSIPDEYEYVSTDEIDDELGIDLEGYAFASDEYLLFVNCQLLPEEFSLHVLERNVGEVEATQTHESTEAAEIATERMNTYC